MRGIALERLDVSGNALEEGGVSALARALRSSEWVQTVQLASHPLPVQQLKAGGSVEIDGQKLTDFDLQLILEVVGCNAHRVDADLDIAAAAIRGGAVMGGGGNIGGSGVVGADGAVGGAGGGMGGTGVGLGGAPIGLGGADEPPADGPLPPIVIPSMSLGYNAITEKGAGLLAAAIAKGRVRVEELNLRGNKIGRDGAIALLRSMMDSGCPTSLLDLSDNMICGLTADGDGKYSAEAVTTVCQWLTTEGNPVRSLKLGQNQLCGVNWKGRGDYTSVAVDALCDALGSSHCQLKDLRVFGNCWGNKDAHKLASVIGARTAPLDMLDMRWNEV